MSHAFPCEPAKSCVCVCLVLDHTCMCGAVLTMESFCSLRAPRSCWNEPSQGGAPLFMISLDPVAAALQSTLSIDPPPPSRTPEPQDPATSQPSRPLPPLPPTTPKALSVSAAAPAPAATEATSVPQLVTGGTLYMLRPFALAAKVHSFFGTCMPLKPVTPYQMARQARTFK